MDKSPIHTWSSSITLKPSIQFTENDYDFGGSLRRLNGCPQKFINIIRSFHDGMQRCVLNNCATSTQGRNFKISIVTSLSRPISGSPVRRTKQGCVLAPLIFGVFFQWCCMVAFKDSCSDKGVFNLRRLQAARLASRFSRQLIYMEDLHFVNDYMHSSAALLQHSQRTMHSNYLTGLPTLLTGLVSLSAWRSLKKT